MLAYSIVLPNVFPMRSLSDLQIFLEKSENHAENATDQLASVACETPEAAALRRGA